MFVRAASDVQLLPVLLDGTESFDVDSKRLRCVPRTAKQHVQNRNPAKPSFLRKHQEIAKK